MYAVSQEAVVAELAYRRTRASDELHHSRAVRTRRGGLFTTRRAATRRIGR